MPKGYMGKLCVRGMYPCVHVYPWDGGTGKEKAKQEIWDVYQTL